MDDQNAAELPKLDGSDQPQDAPADEMTLDALMDFFRDGHGPKGSAAIMDKLDAAYKRLAELEAALGDAKKAAKATAVPKAAQPRKLGPIASPMDREAIMAAIGAADSVEIAFSDGKREIAGLPPFAIEGNAWRMTAAGVGLTMRLVVHGPDRTSAPYSLAGYALILNGKLAAFSTRSEPIAIPPGSTFELINEVFFG